MIIDVKGLPCPQPLIEVKKVIDKLTEPTDIVVEVDDATVLNNVVDYLLQLGIESTHDQTTIKFTTGEVNSDAATIACPTATNNQNIVVIKQQVMGAGDDNLGAILMKAYLNTLLQVDNLPSHIIFYNGGVKFTVDDSSVRDVLVELESKGVMLIICGSCVDYYGLKEQISVGVISNMYKIAELLHSSATIVYP
ncbi:MAG: sulfurtransferase-like selenium metabolism protein YedF [Rikenellaceae bacterium]